MQLAVPGLAWRDGRERQPAVIGVGAQMLKVDVGSTRSQGLEQQRCVAALDGGGDLVGSSHGKLLGTQVDLGTRLPGQAKHEDDDQDGEDHGQDPDQQGRGRSPFRRHLRHLRSIPGVHRPYRVVVAKPGLDGHDRGAKVIARALRDAGFEVIYTGLHQTPEQIVETAIQEDADAVGLSLLSGAHMTLFPEVIELLKQRGVGDVLVFGGGIIPDADIPKLKELGVGEIFTPGASLGSISGWLEAALDGAESDRAETDA